MLQCPKECYTRVGVTSGIVRDGFYCKMNFGILMIMFDLKKISCVPLYKFCNVIVIA